MRSAMGDEQTEVDSVEQQPLLDSAADANVGGSGQGGAADAASHNAAADASCAESATAAAGLQPAARKRSLKSVASCDVPVCRICLVSGGRQRRAGGDAARVPLQRGPALATWAWLPAPWLSRHVLPAPSSTPPPPPPCTNTLHP